MPVMTALRLRPRYVVLFALGGALLARGGNPCQSRATALTLSTDQAGFTTGAQHWSDLDARSTVVELWPDNSLHLSLALGAQGGPALWCNLPEASLVPGVHSLSQACLGDALSLQAADGGNPTNWSPVEGTLEVLTVSPHLFSAGGQVRLRLDVPTATLDGGQSSGTLTLQNVVVDGTFGPLPDCGGGCSCADLYQGWRPGGG
jgi:hypothetical protein